MPRVDYVRCKSCGRHTQEVGELSHVRLCSDCGIQRLDSNVLQMMARSGPNWTRWRKAMAACVGGALLDDERQSA